VDKQHYILEGKGLVTADQVRPAKATR
jgi:hypothetical protein